MEQLPDFLKEKIINQYGKDLSEKIFNGYIKKKTTLRINTLKSTKNKVIEELEKNKIEFESVLWNENALIINNNEEIVRNLNIYRNGEIYLQSLSSMLPPIILEPKSEENILDMTAAPGGKTTQIAALTQNEAYITACEKNKIRLERLKYNLEKQGAKFVNVMQEDARKLSDFLKFDKILLDAPCSGSGTLNVYDKKFTEELIKRSSKTQEDLLKKALKILKNGGEMVYSTCSILNQENEYILNKVLKNLKCEIVPIELPNEIETLKTKIKGTICVCPTKYFEGFFIAKIRKLAK